MLALKVCCSRRLAHNICTSNPRRLASIPTFRARIASIPTFRQVCMRGARAGMKSPELLPTCCDVFQHFRQLPRAESGAPIQPRLSLFFQVFATSSYPNSENCTGVPARLAQLPSLQIPPARRMKLIRIFIPFHIIVTKRASPGWDTEYTVPEGAPQGRQTI
jgi:hypothetical protein